MTHDELMGLTAARIIELAGHPLGFEPPVPAARDAVLERDWQDAEAAFLGRSQVQPARSQPQSGARLQASTLDFIRNGAEEGGRNTRLFQATANLREFDAPPELISALLREPALDSGMPPKEVSSVIRSGIAHVDARARKEVEAA